MGSKSYTTHTRKTFGYQSIYEALIDDLANQRIWFLLVSLLLASAGTGLLFIFIPRITQIKNVDDVISLFKDSISFLLFASLAYGVGGGVLVGIATGLHDPNNQLYEVVARILISTPKPYKKGYGLNLEEIASLAEIARIEQSSSDWRGNFLTIIVWSVVVGILGEVGDYVTVPTISFPQNVYPTYSQLLVILFITIWVFLIIFAISFSLMLSNYIGKYFGREPANRVILFACQEATSILCDYKLDGKKALTIKQKNQIATKLFCKILEASHGIDLSKKRVFVFMDDKDNSHLLIFDKQKRKIF